jgi:hypothetical protein
MDSLSAPFAGMSLIVEISGALELGLLGTFVLAGALKSQLYDASQMTDTGPSEVCRKHSVAL